MIVIDYPHENLLQPFQRHSYSTNELEKLLALETEDFRIGGPVPVKDEQLPMELQQVKDILIRSERNLKINDDKNSHLALEKKQSYLSASDHLELDLSGLVESIVDSDDEEESESQSSQESFMVRDVVRDCLEKEPSERTESDIQTLMDFMQHLPAFANMTQNVRHALCAVMVFAVVEKAGSTVMENGEELDSWSVILNGSVEIILSDEESTFLHLGDSFGVEPSLKKMHHKGVMKTRVDDCQFVCIAQSDYYRILTQGKSNIKVIEEGGEVVMVTEHQSTDGGNREGEVVIKAKPEKLIWHLVEDHSVIDPTFVEDFLLTFKTYFNHPSMICGKLLTWFLDKDYRDKVTRVMLLWVNNHFTDFEGDVAMENYLVTFEKGLELQKMSGQLDLFNMACSAKAKTRTVALVEEDSKAQEEGLRQGDQILNANGQSFEGITYDKAREIVTSATKLKMTLKKNIPGFKEIQATPVIITRENTDHCNNDKHQDLVQRSSSDCTEKRSHAQTRLSAPDITSSGKCRSSRKPPIHMQAPSKTEKVKKALTKFSTLGSLSRHYKLISKSDRDLTSVDSGFHEGDEIHSTAKLSVKTRTRATIPRAFGSMESLNTVDLNNEYPDRVIKLFKADQTFKFFLVFKESNAREVINMALETFGIPNMPSDYSLCEVTVEENGLVRQRRLPDTLTNLADRINLNGRYYLKNNMETGQLLQGDATQELAKENQITLLQLNTQEVARQLTLRDFELLRSVDSREYIYEVWEFQPELWSNLSKFQEIVNRETFWVVTEICSEPNVVKRMKLVKHFIKIAKHCKDCKNFNSTFAIISGLSNITVRRLKSTWDKLPTRYNKMYEDLENLMDPSRSMFKYRSLVSSENVQPPLIPFFPVVKRDLTLIYLNNKSVVDGLINFEKLRMIARVVRQVVKCHSVPYDPSCMFEQDANNIRGVPQSVTSQVVGMVTNSTTWARRSLARDQNPKKVYEEAVMARRVNRYLDDLLVILDEDKLREMSNACENPQGSAPSSVQTRRKNSPTTSPSIGKKEKRNGGKLTDPSPLASRSDRFQSVEDVFEQETSSLRGEQYSVEARQPDLRHPDNRHPTQDMRQPEIRHPDNRHPTQDMRQPEIRHPDNRHPTQDMRQPEIRHPDNRHPTQDMRQPEIRQLDMRQPEIRQQDMRYSDVRQPIQDMRQTTQDLRQKELRQTDMRYKDMHQVDMRQPTQDTRQADFRHSAQDMRQQGYYSDIEVRYTQTR
ncbi:hypothetical protein QZH41_016184, partial [Actinostola sp. cb2023]